VVRFSDLEKKRGKKEAEPESSVFEHLSEEESTPLDANYWYQRACRFVEDVFAKVRNEEKPNLSEGEDLIEEIVQACLRGTLPQELLIKAQY
jgi:hypothetical protein